MAGSVHRTAYRVFLRLYPAAFRKRYGSDMEELVARMIQRERERGGVWAVIRLWAGVVRDTLMRAAAERAAAFRRRLHGGHAPRSRFRESLGAILRDLSHAVRSLRRRPGFAMVAIATLAVGIGANTSLFSVVYGVLLRPLPYHEPDRLVAIRSTKAEWEHSDVARFRFVWRRGFAVSYLDYQDWLEATTVFEGLGAYVAAV